MSPAPLPRTFFLLCWFLHAPNIPPIDMGKNGSIHFRKAESASTSTSRQQILEVFVAGQCTRTSVSKQHNHPDDFLHNQSQPQPGTQECAITNKVIVRPACMHSCTVHVIQKRIFLTTRTHVCLKPKSLGQLRFRKIRLYFFLRNKSKDAVAAPLKTPHCPAFAVKSDQQPRNP